MVKFNIMKMTKLAIILFGFVTLFNACSFEDEIEPYQGQFTVNNNSSSSFNLTIDNSNLEEQTEPIELTINGNTTMNIPLDKGYIYKVQALEVNTGQPELSIYNTTITITAHEDSEWSIPAD